MCENMHVLECMLTCARALPAHVGKAAHVLGSRFGGEPTCRGGVFPPVPHTVCERARTYPCFTDT